MLVGSPGFEPESRESKSQSLDQASRRPLFPEQQRQPDSTIKVFYTLLFEPSFSFWDESL